MKTTLSILLTLAITLPATWFASRAYHGKSSATQAPSTSAPPERKLLFYQSAMHPWIKSDKPGTCTICGMDLTPVYEGESGASGSDTGETIVLTQSMIQVLNVQTAEAQIRPLDKTLKVAGIIDDNTSRRRILSAYTSGRLEKLHVNYVGIEVEEGQPLAEFYSPNLLQAEREYRVLTGDMRQATRLRLLQMGLTPDQIENLPAKSEEILTSSILSPMIGTIVKQMVLEGQYVQEGEALFEIADFSTMWFQFDAYEQDLPWIQPDLPVKITTPSHPGISFSGTIAFLEPSLNPATRTSKVRVELENPLVNGRRLFLHRLYADGWVQTQADETLTIPRSAVIETGSEAVAYVDLGEGQYTRRVLSIGRRGDTLLEILSGLDAGEKVVVNGNLLLDGQAEMNRSFALPTQKMPPLDAVQTQALKQIFSWANTLSTALANDDLEQFNTQAANFHSAMSTLMNDFKAIGTEWHPHLRGIEDHSHFETSNTLEEARKQFYNFISSAVTLAQTIRPLQKEFSNLKVFECPMTKNVFPGAPTTARWIQESSTILNPFMGKKMLDCGIEVKP